MDLRLSLMRQPRFESFEDRLALSAQPAAHVPLALDAARDLEVHAGDVAPSTGDVQDLTGVNYVRNQFGFDGGGQTVAVIDSGIAYDHHALGHGFGPGHRVVGGWDFAENDADPYDDAPAGFHGTHVAGIIGSSDATYRGVAPGADLVALRVMDDQGNGDFSWVASALQWVHEHRHDYRSPITTVNLSLGTAWNANTVPHEVNLEAKFQQLKNDGIFISVSAGNSFAESQTPGLSYPAASSNVVPVASVDADGQLSSFSQRNSRVIAAPGRNITSTVPDAIFGGDGDLNDFAASSGTSMAAPHVAGSATLIREAMQFVGTANINEDTINNVMRSTADSIFDPVTATNYLRLNVRHAIDAIMPTDEYGSTAATAYSLGTVTSSRSLTGQISRLRDQDYFAFTAGATGTASLTAAGDLDMVTSWQRVGGPATSHGNTLSLDVVAGQSYTVGLGSSAGLGHYRLDVNVQSRVADWGGISFLTVADQNLRGGDTSFQIQATRDGLLSIQAKFDQTAGDVNLELYDSRGALVAASRSTTGTERVDVRAMAGESFSLRVTGVNRDVDFQLANLVSLGGGGAVDVYGTPNADTFVFQAGATQQLTVNGLDYSFARSAASQVRFHGRSGNDTLTITGSSAQEEATLRVGSVALVSSTYRVDGDSVESVRVLGGGGQDVAKFYGSVGDDLFVNSPTGSSLRGQGFANSASGFAVVTHIPADDYGSTAATAFSLGVVTSNRTLTGVIDRVGDQDFFSFTAGATGTASFTATPDTGLVTSWQRVGGPAAISGNLISFDVVTGQTYTVGLGSNVGSGNYRLNLSVASRVIDWGDVSFQTIADQDLRGASNSFQLRATRDGLLTIQATFAQAAGDVNLELYDSRGGLVAASRSTGGGERVDVNAMAGQTFELRVTGSNRDVDFRLANLVSRVGTTVDVYGTTNADTFAFRADATRQLTVNDIDYSFSASAAAYFRFHGGDGSDTIVMTGSSANDQAVLRVGTVSLVGGGYRAAGDGFESVRVLGGGGQDVAKLYDSIGDDVFTATPNVALLQGTGFANRVEGFATVTAYATQGGIDRANFVDSAGDDVFKGLTTYSYLRGTGFYNSAEGFDVVSAYARHGGHDVAHIYDSEADGNFTRTVASTVVDTHYGPPAPAPRARSLQDFLACANRHATTLSSSQVRANGFGTVTGDSLAGEWAPANVERKAVDRVFEQLGSRR